METEMMRQNILALRPWYKRETVVKWSPDQVLKIYYKIQKETTLLRKEPVKVSVQLVQPRLFKEDKRECGPMGSIVRDYALRILDGPFETGQFEQDGFMIKCSFTSWGHYKVVRIYKEGNEWTTTLLQSNPAKVVNARTKVMCYIESAFKHIKITRQIRRDTDGLKMLFFDKPDDHGRPQTIALE
jgi:hypothetical protein